MQMKFKDIFNVYSKRNEKKPDIFVYTVPETLRNKIFLFCREVFSGQFKEGSHVIRLTGGQDFVYVFWDEIRRMLLYRHGKLKLSNVAYNRNEIEDTINFLYQCEDKEFLDFLEYIFRVECLFHVCSDENNLVREINRLFESENVGYELTEMVKVRTKGTSQGYPFMGQEVETVRVVQYPNIIRKDNQVIHEIATKPTLLLLSDKIYITANKEYLEALVDYNNNDYGNCLVKCGSALESVLKIICHHKKWNYQQEDTAGTLIKTVIKNLSLEPFFEQHLIIVANLRNKLSKAHGSGVYPRNVPKHYAKFALNATASIILFLIDEIDA